jgi:hypothetical protein
MEETMFNYRKKILAAAVVTSLSLPAGAQADTITMSWSGTLTLLSESSTGGFFFQNADAIGNTWDANRTAITGSLSYDTVTGTGSGTIVSFSFCGSGDAVFTSMSLQTIGDGMGGSGSLVLGNMLWNWNANNGIPVSIVWDASGLLSAVNGGLSGGQMITGGALPASDNTDTIAGAGGTTYPIGPALLATTVWDTTLVGPACAFDPQAGSTCFGRSPSGTLPLVTDTVVDATNGDLGVGGSPMPAPPFTGFNMNIDILSAQVTDIVTPSVPLPAAVWLFGSGLAGLVSLARRKRRHGEKRQDA